MTRSNAKVGVLFLGCGRVAEMHSRMLRGLGGFELFYASRDRLRADALCRRFAGRRCYGSYEAALADPAAGVALVATPTALHREQALLALEAGKDVIVEKPAFMCAADADFVSAVAATAGRRVLVAENYFYKPIARHLRQTVGSGSLGEVRFVSLNATKRQAVEGWRGIPQLSGGGALFEAGVHWINFASNIGLEVEAVEAYRAGPGEGPDRSSLVVFRYAGGAVCTLAHSWELAAPFRGLRLSKVQGTFGAVTFESNGVAHVTTGRMPSIGVAIRDPLGYRAMFEDFRAAILTDAQPQFTFDMARRDLLFLEQAQHSMMHEPRVGDVARSSIGLP